MEFFVSKILFCLLKSTICIYAVLRKGCPLSPFLFLLVAEALSRLIHNAKEIRKIEGIKVSNLEEVTHTLFVDDVLGFGKGTIMEKYLPIQRRQIGNFQRSITK